MVSYLCPFNPNRLLVTDQLVGNVKISLRMLFIQVQFNSDAVSNVSFQDSPLSFFPKKTQPKPRFIRFHNQTHKPKFIVPILYDTLALWSKFPRNGRFRFWLTVTSWLFWDKIFRQEQNEKPLKSVKALEADVLETEFKHTWGALRVHWKYFHFTLLYFNFILCIFCFEIPV